MSTVRRHIPEYDPERMYGRQSGPAGVAEADLAALIPLLERAKAAVLKPASGAVPGFLSIPERTAEARDAERAARETAKRSRTLVVLGIGGSDLGARAIVQALGASPGGKGMDVRFLESGADPEEIARLLASIDLKRTTLNIVSKSGDTVEPMSAFLVLRDRLIKRVGRKRHAAQVVATTDASRGTLHEIARREGYRTLLVPADIGGRFSALTPVGLFPAACAGVSSKKLLAGAEAMRDAFSSAAAAKNGPLLFAGLHHDGYVRRGQKVTVLMPYAASLREFAFWFRQLWAESLGKTRTRGGKTANHGFTPVAALGPADQHSQIQLYNEGPADKNVTFLAVGKYRSESVVPRAYADLAPAKLLAGKKLGDLMRAELEATSRSLASHGRPSGILTIPSITPESVGSLMMFFMLATATMAELLDVDAYDQPGVEEGKRLIRASLARK